MKSLIFLAIIFLCFTILGVGYSLEKRIERLTIATEHVDKMIDAILEDKPTEALR